MRRPVDIRPVLTAPLLQIRSWLLIAFVRRMAGPSLYSFVSEEASL